MTYTQWCEQHDCHHAHCPLGCEHPQPFVLAGTLLLCGRCWHKLGASTEMIPCVPAICD